MLRTIFLVIFSEIGGKPFLSLLQEDARSNEQEHKMHIKNVKNEPNKLNERLFTHLLQEKKESSRIPSCLKISKNLLNVAPDIPETDYEESKDELSIINPVHKNMRQRDLWGNAYRQNSDKVGLLKCAQNKIPTNTLKEALRNRPPVADFMKEITKANEEDIVKRKQRERYRLYSSVQDIGQVTSPKMPPKKSKTEQNLKTKSQKCEFFDRGYCKKGEDCEYQHPDKVCSKSNCFNEKCHDPHPNPCWWGPRCKFYNTNICLFSHDTTAKNDDKRVGELEKLVVKLEKES